MRRYTHTFVISDRFLQAFFRRRLFSLPFAQTSFTPSPSRKVGRHCHGGGLPRLAEACHLAALAEACRICRPALPPCLAPWRLVATVFLRLPPCLHGRHAVLWPACCVLGVGMKIIRDIGEADERGAACGEDLREYDISRATISLFWE